MSSAQGSKTSANAPRRTAACKVGSPTCGRAKLNQIVTDLIFNVWYQSFGEAVIFVLLKETRRGISPYFGIYQKPFAERFTLVITGKQTRCG
jgi:hypothetical protein